MMSKETNVTCQSTRKQTKRLKVYEVCFEIGAFSYSFKVAIPEGLLPIEKLSELILYCLGTIFNLQLDKSCQLKDNALLLAYKLQTMNETTMDELQRCLHAISEDIHLIEIDETRVCKKIL